MGLFDAWRRKEKRQEKKVETKEEAKSLLEFIAAGVERERMASTEARYARVPRRDLLDSSISDRINTIKGKRERAAEHFVRDIVFWEKLGVLAQPDFGAICALMDDPEGAVRKATARVLGEIGDVGAAEALVRAWKEHSDYAAAEALVSLRAPGAADALAQVLDDAEWSPRRHLALRHLLQLQDERAIEPVIEFFERTKNLEHQSLPKQGIAKLIAEAFPDPRFYDSMVSLLGDWHYGCRIAAIEALQAIDDPRAAVFIAPLLKDRDDAVPPNAERALKHFGERAVTLLKEASEAGGEVDQNAISRALSVIHGG